MRLIILTFCLLSSLIIRAQEDKIVNLTVSGQGKTQNEAKQDALRNAIEQAFGTFISSKTEILNDDLLKDEIVSISNGNIRKFEVISEVKIPNDEYSILLNATVSVTKLTSFVESKGVNAEFKGSLFAFNVKQQILNEKNEIKAIEDLVHVLKKISDSSFDFSISSNEPISINSSNEIWRIPLEINITTNKNILLYKKYFFETLKSISLSDDEVTNYINLGKRIFPISLAMNKNNTVYSILRNEESISKIVSLIYYFNNSLLSFSINNGINNFKIQSKPNQIKDINDKQFRVFLRIGNNGGDWHGYNKNSVIITGGGSYKSKSIILNHNDWYKTNQIWNGNNRENITGLNSDDFLLGYNKVNERYSNDSQFSFVSEFKKNIQNGLAGLVISFIGIEEGQNIIKIYFDDIRSLDEINNITEYKVVPISKLN